MYLSIARKRHEKKHLDKGEKDLVEIRSSRSKIFQKDIKNAYFSPEMHIKTNDWLTPKPTIL
uniref:Uncharacterized protein n=1 Tax=Romanomermis culicivorax TaxID=13658 RepID=A0A915I2N7_ROMCU